ncbi:hypothetical protein HX030_06590 [Myroides odoratimimus]|uniref:DUF6804 family protein n=1 Tax=Myroides odoratimimus TaxID=76832 RepID=UPI0025780B04|nr:DUF6804 family protein [Myroides odoratimimus]MDM1466720.1 hypothetical protein [Myroides odoratimimus]MDM1470221.1 hypothetical protein [Myroides odoratimimus]MDM1479882.1 hypothetical protein [Myroides odoratimimus]MDM1496406.1 hypothetical protein [Myroides odoratimimus]MDM1529575.1 hypothetical protein [Myroides odoratimimus]
MEKTIKITIAVLLLLCLLKLPYGFYQFVRFVACIGFSYFAYKSYYREEKTEMFIYIVLALLFQPFLKVALGRSIWNIVDVIVAIGLFINIPNSNKKINRE